MAFKRMKPARPAAYAPIESHVITDLRRADALMEKGRLDEAYEIASRLHLRYPQRKEPLLFLMDLAVQTDDMIAYEEAIEALVKLAPGSAEYVLAYARSAASNGLVALTIERFDRFLERWPQHSEAPGIREAQSVFKEDLGRQLDDAGFNYPDRFELAARNDEIQLLISRQRYDEAQSVAQKALDREPNYVPILNNMALLLLVDGKWREAVPYSERAVEIDPENVYALAHLARINSMLGYKQEAAFFAKRMKAGRAGFSDKTGKVIETLSFLGDDESVLEAYQEALKDEDDPALRSPLTHHLAGAATMRLGREREAKDYWKRALKLDPDFDMALENLADLKLPVGVRHGPWAFPLRYWISRATMSDLTADLIKQPASGSEDGAKDALRKALLRHPEVETLVPILLERGDPSGRQFAQVIASTAQTPAMLESLRDFALSRNGPDGMRMQAATLASDTGVFDTDSVSVFVKGKQQDVGILGWEIHNEPAGSHRPAVQKLLVDGTQALFSGDFARAQKLLKRALEMEPGAPDIINNLANSYKAEGRDAEALALMKEISERFPDYFFGTINMIQLSIEEGRMDDAKAMLEALSARKRFHSGEFAALAQAQVVFLLQSEEPGAARHWYDMWKQASPDHPGLEYYRPIFEGAPAKSVKRIGRRTRDV